MIGKQFDKEHVNRILAKMDEGSSETATYATSRMRSFFQAKAARRPHRSSLNELIEEIVRQDRKISEKALWEELKKRIGSGVIVKITDKDVIHYDIGNGKVELAEGSGLKDRLSKVKKKIRKAG